jgi:DNA-binding NarL/FixJ family response regulator
VSETSSNAPMDTAGPPVRVLVVEDQTKILRHQLKLLEGSTSIEVVGTALSGEAAIEEARRLRPQVLLLDLGLPRMSGIDVTRVLKATQPEIEILVFTIFDEEEKVLAAVQAGASGYLLKGTPLEKIVEAILEVSLGGTVIQPNLARRLLRHFREGAGAAGEAQLSPPRPLAASEEPEGRRLSSRETEILQLIAKGVSNSEAAAMLEISKATIRTHLEHIYRKLEVTNRVEAVTEGLRKGLIQV